MGYKSNSARLGGGSPFSARQQNSETKNPNKMYFIFTEGVQTEQIYFEELSNYSAKKEEITIHVMNRWKSRSGNSNQYRVAQDVENYINNIANLDKAEKDKFIGYFNQLEGCNVDTLISLANKLDKFVKKHSNLLSNDDFIQQQLAAVVTLSKFDKEYDHICIFVDRDKNSFSDNQFDSLIELCEKNDFILGITNPCFEFYLLLHLSDLREIDNVIISENEKVGSKTFVEDLLNRTFSKNGHGSFKKNSYNARWFLDNYKIGRQNNEDYSKSNIDLKNEIGSSIFNIMETHFLRFL